MRKLLLILLVLLLPMQAWGATYYVKDDGNNGNTGLSDAQAWDTITYAESQWSAGDKILLKCGDSWTEQLNPDVDNLTIGAYYVDGAETEVTNAATLATCGTRPKITLSSGGNVAVSTADVDGLTIQYLWLDQDGNYYCVDSQSTHQSIPWENRLNNKHPQ